MAKKVLTPEEVQNKLEKKSAKRKLFFGTFTKALAFFLAIAMAYSLAIIAFTPATAPAASGSVQSGQQSGGDVNAPSGDVNTPSGDVNTPSGDSGSASTPSGDSGSASTPSGDSGSQGSAQTGDAVKKEVADAVNAATAKAAKGNYELKRVCKFQEGKGIKVSMLGGDATSALNGLITSIDPNANLNSVVGGFLGEGTKEIKVTNGVGKRYGSDGTMADLTNEEKDYMLKATNITANDLASATKNGNVYTFTLAKVSDPQKDGKNSMHKVTNDFITESQVKSAIASITDAITVNSANVDYYNIKFEATIENGTLKKFVMNYQADAKMKLKLLMSIDGSGSMDVTTTYTF